MWQEEEHSAREDGRWHIVDLFFFFFSEIAKCLHDLEFEH